MCRYLTLCRGVLDLYHEVPNLSFITIRNYLIAVRGSGRGARGGALLFVLSVCASVCGSGRGARGGALLFVLSVCASVCGSAPTDTHGGEVPPREREEAGQLLSPATEHRPAGALTAGLGWDG
jgi:hypothetical protein